MIFEKRLSGLILLVFFSHFAFAQSHSLRGKLIDGKDKSELISANVVVFSVSDTTQKFGTQTDLEGRFTIANMKSGQYVLTVSYIGYVPFQKNIDIAYADVDLGTLLLTPNTTVLKDVKIEATVLRAQQKGDTTEYNASAFKTNPDAVAEDLITKMPGITNENGTIKAHGEEVKKVLIDGKEFFGDDVSTALKNLPADVVEKIQVFDQMSDQAQFTGFNDGNTKKALNIKTKNGISNAVFGKVYGGFGYITDARYSSGGNVNWFRGDRRISVLAMSNNINQQNFSLDDITGAMGSGGGGGRFGGRGGGSNAASNLMAGQQNGISTTHAVGLNYSDVWGNKKNIKWSGSYFFNHSDNLNASEINRDYFNTEGASNRYEENNTTRAQNINHRINIRFQYDIDSANSLIITPVASFQQNKQTYALTATNMLADGNTLSNTYTKNASNNFGYNISSEFLYRHKFRLQGRTISLSISPNVNNRNGDASQYSSADYASDSITATVIDQRSASLSNSYGVNGSLNYTEPVGQKGQLQFTYTPSYTWTNSDKSTNTYDSLTADYSLLNTALSNKYTNTYIAQKGGFSYRYRTAKFNFMAAFNLQYASLNGTSVFPFAYTVNKSFTNVLPVFRFEYNFANKSNFRLNYRTSTSAPSITQLQSVIDNSNVLLLSTGNPNLKQSYTHQFTINYGGFNVKNAHSMFIFASASLVENYVGRSTLIAQNDTVLSELVTLYKGSQLTKPINLNGYWTANAFFTYGLPVKALKSNLNINVGLTYNRNPGLINYQTNWANNYRFSGGFTLSSNISSDIDFTINYSPSYTIVKNTLQRSSDNNYFNHNASVKFNWLFWKGFVFNTSLQNTLYAGIAQGFNQNIFLWNASLGYKFLKSKSLELKAGVNDILNQNSGVSRTVTETYIEDTRTQILKRYFMLTLTYTFRNIQGTEATTRNNSSFTPPPTAMPPHHGM